jgi:hypothetical protein
LHGRSISVDVQYFVVAVVAVFMSNFASSRAPAFLAVLAISAAAAALVLSIKTASQLITAPGASALLVPMPVIGIDWMKVSPNVILFQPFPRFISQAGGRHDARSRRLLLLPLSQVTAPAAATSSAASRFASAASRSLPWVMGVAVAHFSRHASRARLTPRADATTGRQPRSLLFSLGVVAVALLLSPCMNTTTACSQFLSPGHATLFLALHRPAFSVFVVVILIQYANQGWQRNFEATWYFLIFARFYCPYLMTLIVQAQGMFHAGQGVRVIIRFYGPASCALMHIMIPHASHTLPHLQLTPDQPDHHGGRVHCLGQRLRSPMPNSSRFSRLFCLLPRNCRCCTRCHTVYTQTDVQSLPQAFVARNSSTQIKAVLTSNSTRSGAGFRAAMIAILIFLIKVLYITSHIHHRVEQYPLIYNWERLVADDGREP